MGSRCHYPFWDGAVARAPPVNPQMSNRPRHFLRIRAAKEVVMQRLSLVVIAVSILGLATSVSLCGVDTQARRPMEQSQAPGGRRRRCESY